MAKSDFSAYTFRLMEGMLTCLLVLCLASASAQNQSEIQMKTIKIQDYHTDIAVSVTAQEAFKSISKVSDWWTTDFEGHSEKLNDVFTVRFGETFIKVKVVELISSKKISWHVVDCHKHWLKDKKEWKDTIMRWEISTEKNATRINFTHVGLIPGIECYKGCEKAWDFYINESLFRLLTKGKGIPELK